ncbi:hypothetical protein [Streptomyces sp. NBC_01187]|uniref:hypothetical protein n=1 Tax=Streptomyces sp. NBC_01187 TaxID=2903766 RepID=UPI002F90CAAB|nr:hypothetical protein OG220_42245 [Streptomyces sp. NBC_01187]
MSVLRRPLDGELLREIQEDAEFVTLPENEPEVPEDLTWEEMYPLRAFLALRLAELDSRQKKEDDAHFAAYRLRQITDSDCLRLEDLTSAWQHIRYEGRAAEPGAVQLVRQELGSVWNELVETAAHFADHPDFLPRWRPLPHVCHEDTGRDQLGKPKRGGPDGEGNRP